MLCLGFIASENCYLGSIGSVAEALHAGLKSRVPSILLGLGSRVLRGWASPFKATIEVVRTKVIQVSGQIQKQSLGETNSDTRTWVVDVGR